MTQRKQKALELFEEILNQIPENLSGEEIVLPVNENFVPDPILTSKEVCAYFKISQTTLERRIRAGLKYSQAVKKGNRLFKRSACERFFNLKNN